AAREETVATSRASTKKTKQAGAEEAPGDATAKKKKAVRKKSAKKKSVRKKKGPDLNAKIVKAATGKRTFGRNAMTPEEIEARASARDQATLAKIGKSKGKNLVIVESPAKAKT